MLVASLNGNRIEALMAERRTDYCCPQCNTLLVLKKGAIKVAHFSHKPPTDCTWGSAETQHHLRAKVILRDAFRAKGFLADYEVPIQSLQGDRRADVLVRTADGRFQWALEIQHTPILFDAIERRTGAYMAINLPVIWVGILNSAMRENATVIDGGILIRNYTIRPWEKWAHALAFKELWYIDPDEGTLWQGSFGEHLIHVESTSWYEPGGEERHAGGFTRSSKRWRTLTLKGPFNPSNVHLDARWRASWSSPVFRLPAGYFGRFVTG